MKQTKLITFLIILFLIKLLAYQILDSRARKGSEMGQEVRMGINQNYYKWSLSLIGAALVMMSGCAKEANPRIAITMSNTTPQARLMDLFLPSSYATVSDVKMCFKRLRFKMVDSSEAGSAQSSSDSGPDDKEISHNIDFHPGEVSLSSSWIYLGEVTVPAGTYRRIEFDIEKDCGENSSGNSISFTNNHGQFWSDQTVNIRFEGEFEASHSGQQINLYTADILDALDDVVSLSDVKDTLLDARVKGSF